MEKKVKKKKIKLKMKQVAAVSVPGCPGCITEAVAAMTYVPLGLEFHHKLTDLCKEYLSKHMPVSMMLGSLEQAKLCSWQEAMDSFKRKESQNVSAN